MPDNRIAESPKSFLNRALFSLAEESVDGENGSLVSEEAALEAVKLALRGRSASQGGGGAEAVLKAWADDRASVWQNIKECISQFGYQPVHSNKLVVEDSILLQNFQSYSQGIPAHELAALAGRSASVQGEPAELEEWGKKAVWGEPWNHPAAGQWIRLDKNLPDPSETVLLLYKIKGKPRVCSGRIDSNATGWYKAQPDNIWLADEAEPHSWQPIALPAVLTIAAATQGTTQEDESALLQESQKGGEAGHV